MRRRLLLAEKDEVVDCRRGVRWLPEKRRLRELAAGEVMEGDGMEGICHLLTRETLSRWAKS